MNLLDNQKAAEAVDQVYLDLESQIMQNIARHLRDWKQPIDTDKWLLQKLAEIGKLNQENIKMIAKSAGLSRTAAERMLNAAAEEAIENVEPGLKKLAKKGLAKEAVPVHTSKNVEQSMSALEKQAKSTLNKCNTVMLYKARDAYKKLVQDVAGTAKEIEGEQSFLDVLNANVEAVVAGVESRQQAVRKCIRIFNEKGIPAFVDAKGREWTPEAYVNMAMRNTARQTAEEVQSARIQDAGLHLIQIDSHSGSRPKCAKDQGKIFDLNNESGEVEDLHGEKIKFYPWRSSSYGEPDGILGINCRHHKWPFVPGVSVQRYFPTEDMDANNREYKETQVQRALEREVRKQKRECMLYDEIGDKDAFEEAAVKLKSKEAQLKQYVGSKEHLHRRKDREQVVGFDKRVSAEAVRANKVYAKAMQTDTIKIKDTTDKWAKEAKEELLSDEKSLSMRHKEVAVIYDSNGKYLFTKRGGEKSVSFTQREVRKLKGCVVSHNHPSGGSFSEADWKMFVNGKLQEIRAIGKDGTYYLRSNENSKIYQLNDKDISSEYQKIRNSVRKKYHDMYKNGKISKTERFLMSSDEYNKLFAEKYGIEYGKDVF